MSRSQILGLALIWASGALFALGLVFLFGEDKVLGAFLLTLSPASIVLGITVLTRRRRRGYST